MKLFKYSQRLVVLSLMTVVVAGLAACGDDNSSDGGGNQAPVSGSNEKAVKAGSEYIGGTAGKADSSLSPISIGWINQDESPAGSTPENTAAVKSAISFVNDELGGIDGHPIKLVQCPVGGSEGQGKQCAQKFLNDSDIKAVMYGYLAIGGQSFMATMAPDGKESKKPIIGLGPDSPEQGALKNAYFSAGGFLAVSDHPYMFKDYLNATNVAQIWSDIPVNTAYIKTTVDAFTAAGVKSTVGQIPAAGTDVVGALVAGGVQDADGIMPVPDDASQCIAMAKGLEQLGVADKPTLGYSVCFDKAVKEALGDYPKWIYARDTVSPNLPDPLGQAEAFKYAAEKYAGAKAEIVVQGPYSANAFGLVMLAAKWGNALGPDNITNEGVAEQAKAVSGNIWMGDPSAKFGTPPLIGVPSLGLRYYQYDGDGKWSDVTDAEWVTAPAEG